MLVRGDGEVMGYSLEGSGSANGTSLARLLMLWYACQLRIEGFSREVVIAGDAGTRVLFAWFQRSFPRAV